jgi:hypothetical protein
MILLSILLLVLIVLYVKKFIAYRKLFSKYKDVIDIDQAVDNLNDDYEKLKEKYNSSREIYKKLKEQKSILEDDMDMIEFGVYESHFEFDTSEHYKEEIKNVRQQQKESIKEKSAIICHINVEVEGSKREGSAMVNQYKRMMLRAFNNECDASILKVRWNNVITMEKRMESAFEAVNKLGTRLTIDIQRSYLKLKIAELRLAYEYQEKKHQEKEEQREIREQMREEEKLNKELEKAKKEAERDENALEKAKRQLKDAHGEESARLELKIKELEEALENSKRAISMAQLTKSGHVYVISNIGSFGEGIYKIGMTRRLEPMLRVKELGDASVPFTFDVHAMIYSENAPEFEKKLHQNFKSKRVNMVNLRKEYFRTTLDEIEEVVKQENAQIEFTKIAEAKEYHQTVHMLEVESNKVTLDELIDAEFPVNI